MAILGASFQIGRSALTAYQAALAATGQNIANVGNADYARVSARLASLHGGITPAGFGAGSGVGVADMQRHVDDALESRVRGALSEKNGAQTRYDTLRQLESLYGELGEYDLSTRLNDLFGNFSALQTDPQDGPARDLVVNSAQSVVTTIQQHRAGVLQQINDLNSQVESQTQEANAIADEIARLNTQIVAAGAAGRGGDAALRDRRDALLRDLSELVDVRTRPQDNGVVNVYVGSEPLVEYGRSRGMKVETTIQDGIERTEVRFADSHTRVNLGGGKLGASVAARDEDLARQLTDLDSLARGIIYEVNRVHTSGQGLVGYTNIQGTYGVRDITAALNSSAAGLTYPVKNGTFEVQVRDKVSGAITTRRIEVDLDGIGTDDSLKTLATQLGAVPGVTANITPDNRLALSAADGYEIAFNNDTSGALAALGVGTFFDGVSADTFAVNSAIKADPRLIAASRNGAAGDGSNAGLMAAVGTSASALLGGRSIVDFHDRLTGDLATSAKAAEDTANAADTVYNSLQSQREAVSGVNLDEEAINLSLYERAFQGASRYLTVVDTLSTEILSLVS